MFAKHHVIIEFGLAVLFAAIFAVATYTLFSNFPGYTTVVGDVPLIVVVLLATIVGALVGSRIALGHFNRRLLRTGDAGEDAGSIGALLINWGVVTGLVGGAAAGTFNLTASTYQSNLEAERAQSERAIAELAEKEQDYAQLKRDFEQLSSEGRRISVLRPEPQQTAIGTNGTVIVFDWVMADQKPSQRFIIEIRDISNADTEPIVFDYLKMNDEPIQIPASILLRGNDSSSEFIWRVRPGRVVNGRQIALGEWSRYGNFMLYPSIVDRIKKMNVVRIGFSGGFTGAFNVMQPNGSYEGFDQEFAAWLVRELGVVLGMDPESLNAEWLEYRFGDLLNQVQSHRVDLVIASMTRTAEREQRYGIKFSEPYLAVDQIFVSNSPEQASFPAGLKDKVVGASATTINYNTAQFLMNRFGFEVRALDADEDPQRELSLGKVDFIISDNVAIASELGTEFHQYGPPLTKYLGELYQQRFGFDNETYGIAIRDPALLSVVNEILQSDRATEKINELKAKWLKT